MDTLQKQSQSVLVVDDEESIRFAYRHFLSRSGFEVVEAADARRACALAAEQTFDVAVVDRILGGGGDGVHVIKQIHAFQPLCQTVIVSAYPSFESAAETLRYQSFAYLPKPVKKDEICRVVREAAQKSRRLRHERDRLALAADLEKELVRMQAMEAIGTLAGGIAHDFKNMLGVISGSTELALLNADGDPQLTGNLNRIDKAAQNSVRLVEQLLNLSMGGRCRPEATDLNGLIEDVADLVRASLPAHIALELDLDETIAMVRTDAVQIRQCLVNLCLNAKDAINEKPVTSPAGPLPAAAAATESIRIQTAMTQGDRAWGLPDRVVIDVTDSGVGMTEAVRQRLFQPFFSTKSKGRARGLGLAMVATIVRSHGGQVLVDSQPGQGSRFRLLLPAEAEAQHIAKSFNPTI